MINSALGSSRLQLRRRQLQNRAQIYPESELSLQSLFQRWRHLTSAKVLSEQSADEKEGWR